jgi:hypothetical protein
MGHHVATTLHKQVVDLNTQLKAKDAEIAALKRSAGVPQPGPTVTTNNSGGPAAKATFRDLRKDPNKLDGLYAKAAMGTLTDEEVSQYFK